MLFISASERSNLAKDLDYLKNRSVLTVSDAERFAQMGGIIRLYLDNKIKYDVNVDAAEQARLRLDLLVIDNAVRKIRTRK